MIWILSQNFLEVVLEVHAIANSIINLKCFGGIYTANSGNNNSTGMRAGV
jgi:hypothetical protein